MALLIGVLIDELYLCRRKTVIGFQCLPEIAAEQDIHIVFPFPIQFLRLNVFLIPANDLLTVPNHALRLVKDMIVRVPADRRDGKEFRLILVLPEILFYFLHSHGKTPPFQILRFILRIPRKP